MRSKLVDRIPDRTELTEAELDRRHMEHQLKQRGPFGHQHRRHSAYGGRVCCLARYHQMQTRLRGSLPPLSGVIAMRAYVTTIGMIVGLLAAWVVLTPFVA